MKKPSFKIASIISLIIVALLASIVGLLRYDEWPHRAVGAAISDDGRFEIRPGRVFLSRQANDGPDVNVVITNISDRDAVIDRVDSSCGCTLVRPVSNPA